MSLINEALKKAQRLRTDEPATDAPPMPGGGSGKRGAPRSSNSVLLFVAGGSVLVVLSVVATAFWFARTPEPPPRPVAPMKPATETVNTSPVKPAPVITLPTTTITPEPSAPKPEPIVVSPPKSETPAPPSQQKSPVTVTEPKTTPVQIQTTQPNSTPAATPPQTSPVSTAPSPVTDVKAETPVSAAPPPATAAPAAPQSDNRIYAFIDAIKVGAFRASGTDSRVIMNDRMYRVNDIVERNLGLRLTKVEPDSLTFTDGNGTTYVKNF